MRTGGVPVLLTESEQNVRCWISLEGGCGKAVDIRPLAKLPNRDPSTRVSQAGGGRLGALPPLRLRSGLAAARLGYDSFQLK